MSIHDDTKLKAVRTSLVKGMIEYMEEANAVYTQADVQKCQRILEEHLDAVSGAKDRDSALKCVKITVLKLNDLNDSVGGELIETDQREQICEYLIGAGALLGFNGENEDITEEWREW